MSELQRLSRQQFVLRVAVWMIALACIGVMLSSCRTIKHAPADAALLGGTGASIAAGTMIGGPAGGAVAIVGTIATAVATEEMVRPSTAPCPAIVDISKIPQGSSPTPPWWLSPQYYWGVILLAFVAVAILKYAFSARFRAHIRNALWAFMSGKIKAGLMYLLAAGGVVHSDAADKADGG